MRNYTIYQPIACLYLATSLCKIALHSAFGVVAIKGFLQLQIIRLPRGRAWKQQDNNISAPQRCQLKYTHTDRLVERCSRQTGRNRRAERGGNLTLGRTLTQYRTTACAHTYLLTPLILLLNFGRRPPGEIICRCFSLQSPDTQAWQNDYLQGTGCEMYTETLSPSFTGMTFPQASE